MLEFDAKTESLISELPDPEGARLFYERVTREHARAARMFERDAGLLADALALAAWSPLLGATLAQNFEYLTWLARERAAPRVRATEELGESLARFALTHTQLPAQVLLARFRRRELLRIYLHDLRRTTTLVETTEELSNLADAVLQYALQLMQQELENLYGSPQCTDERGRTTAASIAVVALGKLGSRELNYSSDIDLLFLYSDDGETSGAGERGTTTNREFFCKLAERAARLVGQQAGEGAAYRVDLRLRPHGRDGALACSLKEALRYYRETAHAWERQALIRSRASAGSQNLFARFAEGVHPHVYRTDETVGRALFNVRLAKQKIDRFHERDAGGYNVKLGRGGIREIEFIAQALQLAYGGRDTWLHAPHTLISLGRLADRGLITERERTELSDAYHFLRTLEHRLQMEHGLQTHNVPEEASRRETVARRMHFKGAEALVEFNRALSEQTTKVRTIYARVFGESARADESEATASTSAAEGADVEDANAQAFDRGARSSDRGAQIVERVSTVSDVRARLFDEGARASLNPKRAHASVARVLASLDKSGSEVELTDEEARTLARLCGVSEFLGEMLAANPSLASALTTDVETVRARDHRATLRAAIDAERSFRAELSALRRAWARLLAEMIARDASGDVAPRESNGLQSALAAASLNVALLVARREMVRRYGNFQAGPRLAVLGLGRLGSGGVDYGSDLDVVLVYDARTPSPVKSFTHDEAYARMCELLVTALSSLTRDGYLYRVDLRLRPDGRNGALAVGRESFVNYLRERAEVWEWLAYVKLRAVAGDLEFGRAVEEEARRAAHDAAMRAGREVLRAETRRVRERLERERTRAAARGTDIKYGRGGMLDVYFAARYLQLRDGVEDGGERRSTRATLARLLDAGALAVEDFSALDEGYALLRSLDHQLRLVAGRLTLLPAAMDHPLWRDLASMLNYPSSAELSLELEKRTSSIRAAYERITSAESAT